ncbi:glutamate--tRNA ligase [Patescibacteria group bacterium]|nr:glutamate--tRNA ligase [Patescibacteria group bacterium]MCL5409321.1 glutamate--tRNA ligase [Patescibacteria group bacterium]
MKQVVTRYAPSPTGLMHIGQVRTALYSYLLAKQNNGKFILRLEDTDRARLVTGSAENIIDTLAWLGLNWDEGPSYQSTRKQIYQEHAQILLKQGKAFEKEGAIWFKMPTAGVTTWQEVIGDKQISIENSLQQDFVMIKSDGFPTYNFAVVIDDNLMGISHVVRGVEFISSTPKHIALYQAFGWELPIFVHLPLILGSDKSKLSKRHGAKPASDFREDGYLPQAILNYMALISWTPPEGKEILTIAEMIKDFSLSAIHINNPIFDVTKLDWMNGEYIRKMSDEELTEKLQQFLTDHPAKEKIGQVVPLIKERIKKLSDFVPLTDFLWEEPEYDLAIFEKIKVAQNNQLEVLKQILETLENLTKPWDAKSFEQQFRQLADKLGVKHADIFQLIRVAVSGQLVTPPLFESIQIIGEAKTVERIRLVIQRYPNFP